MDANTHRLRNNFILLKNGGKDFDSIVKEMQGVSIKSLKTWDKSYNDEMKKISEHYNLGGVNKLNLGKKDEVVTLEPKNQINNILYTSILSINRNGEYKKQNQIKFNLSLKDSIIFKLWRASTSDLNKLEDKSKIEYLTELVQKSKWAHDILKDQLIEITLNKIELKNGFRYNSNIEIRDNKQLSDVEKAVQFYIENFYHPESMEKRDRMNVEKSNYYYNIGSGILPIALKKIYIENYNGIKNLELNELYVDSQWIFITGENGYGKTSFLQALTIGLFGKKDQYRDIYKNSSQVFIVDHLKNLPHTNIIVEYKNENESFINQTLGDEFVSLKNLVCYGPSRLSMQSGFTNEDENKTLSVTHSLFSPQSTLLNIENRLIIWELSKDKKFKYIVKIFKKLIPNLMDIKLSSDKTKIIYTEREIGTNKKFNSVNILQLASGFRSLIGMVGDMILRFYLNQPEIENPSDFTGIVIIDEFDLHWHPKLQIELPGKLSEIFPFVQFIVSTHSAIPLLGAPKNATIIKINRTKEEGITAEKLDIDITKLTPNIILTSPIFDMDSITSKSKESLDEVRTEDDFQKIQSSDDVDKFLEERAKAGKKYPDTLFA
ncbi:MAG: AAA family ATPase [Saprospiraceae bacterium]|nr:AAA family ATPase [Saprospiraceae bacterium]